MIQRLTCQLDDVSYSVKACDSCPYNYAHCNDNDCPAVDAIIDKLGQYEYANQRDMTICETLEAIGEITQSQEVDSMLNYVEERVLAMERRLNEYRKAIEGLGFKRLE